MTFSLNSAACLSLSLCPESTDEEVDKLHCLNHSGSSATYSDYSPSQGSSGSSNPPGNAHSHNMSHAHTHAPALPAPTKDQAPQTHWTNRYTHTHTLTHTHTHASCSISSPSLRLSIISSSLSIPAPLQSPPSIIHLIHLSNRSIRPLLFPPSFCVALISPLAQSRSERLIRMLQTSVQASLSSALLQSCPVQASVLSKGIFLHQHVKRDK